MDREADLIRDFDGSPSCSAAPVIICLGTAPTPQGERTIRASLAPRSTSSDPTSRSDLDLGRRTWRAATSTMAFALGASHDPDRSRFARQLGSQRGSRPAPLSETQAQAEQGTVLHHIELVAAISLTLRVVDRECAISDHPRELNALPGPEVEQIATHRLP